MRKEIIFCDRCKKTIQNEDGIWLELLFSSDFKKTKGYQECCLECKENRNEFFQADFDKFVGYPIDIDKLIRNLT